MSASIMIEKEIRANVAASISANLVEYDGGDSVGGYVANGYHARRLDLMRHFLMEQPRPNGRLRLLELAPTIPSISACLPREAVELTVADIDESSARRAGEAAGCEYIVFDAGGRWPFGEGAFDIVVAGDLVEHIYCAMPFFEECARVLRASGLLVLSTPNLAGAQDRLRFLFGQSPRQVDPLHEYLRLHIRPFTPRMLVLCLEASGFRVRGLRSNFVVWRTSRGRRLMSARLADVFPSLGGSLVVAAEKRSGDASAVHTGRGLEARAGSLL